MRLSKIVRLFREGKISRETAHRLIMEWAGCLVLLLCVSTASADTITYWPATGQRVYVVDAKNIGPYGRLTKPKGIDVIVIRHGNRWGVLPSSVYRGR